MELVDFENLTSDWRRRQLTMVILKPISKGSFAISFFGTHIKPVQNISRIWIFFFSLRERWISGQIGRARMDRSIAICIAALYHENVFMLTVLPFISPAHPSQKNETGVH